MLSKVNSFGVLGMEAYPVEVEIYISGGLPAINLIGLPDPTVKESKSRLKPALKNSGYDWPDGRITINLTPSDMKKEGACFDLAVALGILAATGRLDREELKEYTVLGELSLDGEVRPIKGILAIVAAMSKLRKKKIILPCDNAREASLISDVGLYPVKTLKETVQCISDPETVKAFRPDNDLFSSVVPVFNIDFSEVKGQFLAKRALEVAVAGGHNMLMIGPPGSGKTMLAKRVPTIMPDMAREEILEATKIHSVAGTLPLKEGIVSQRPFRAVHHTISYAALVGGGSLPQPGEISLSHNGVLFLDELPEFHRDCLEALRQPLEDGYVRVSRVKKSLLFPASFMLVCAMNPCKCGRYNDLKSSCRCSTTQIYSYRSKISGPLLDRIDIHIEVPAVRYQELASTIPAESSAQIKERVNKARTIQRERFKDEGILCNALMSHKQVRKFCALGKEEDELLKMVMTELNFSARAYDKILKVSRTIADLAGSEQIKTEHLSEAIQYRSLDRDFFL